MTSKLLDVSYNLHFSIKKYYIYFYLSNYDNHIALNLALFYQIHYEWYVIQAFFGH